MDEHQFENITNFLHIKNPGYALKRLQPAQIDTLFDKLRSHNQRLTELSRQDPLTQLPNRFYFELSMKRLFAQAERRKDKFAVLSLDLDGFKEINDIYGHKAGDEVLVAVSHALNEVTRSEDLVARLGGDEFIIVLPHIEYYEDAAVVSRKIIEAFSQISFTAYQDLVVRCSIGIAVYPLAAMSVDELIECSDKALYKAKKKKESSFEFFSDKMSQELKYKQKLIDTFQKNLLQNSLSLLYIPILATNDDHITDVHVKLPGVQVVKFDLDNSTFFDNLCVGYLKKIYQNFKQWQDDGVDVKSLKLFVEIEAYMLRSESFKTTLAELFKDNYLFSQVCILHLIDCNLRFLEDARYDFFRQLGVAFCFQDCDSIAILRDLRPRFVNIDVHTICLESLTSQQNIELLNALVNYKQMLGIEVILSNVDREFFKNIALKSMLRYYSGSSCCRSLSSKEFVRFYLKHNYHHSSH